MSGAEASRGENQSTWQSNLLEGAVARLNGRPDGALSASEVASTLEKLALSLRECRQLESLVHRRLPAMPPVGSSYSMPFAERCVPGALSVKLGPDGRLFEISPERRLVSSATAAPSLSKVQPLTEEGWRVDAYDFLPEGRLVVAGRSDLFGQELRLISEISHGAWISRGLSYETGIVTAVTCAPGGAVCFTSSRGLGCIRGLDVTLPKVEWFGDASHGHVSLDYFNDGRLVVGAREGITVWSVLGPGAVEREFVGSHPCPFDDDLAQPVIVRALAGGEIASCDQFGSMRIWRREDSGVWRAELGGLPRGPVCALQALPDGSFLSFSENGVVERCSGTACASRAGRDWRSACLFDMRLQPEFAKFAADLRSCANANGQVLPSGRIVFIGGGMGTGGIRCVFDPVAAPTGGGA